VTTAAAIVSGGRASRLGGVAKGTLMIGGRRIVDRQLEVLRPLFSRVVIIANDPGPWSGLGLTILADRLRDAGPLAGLEAAVSTLSSGEEAIVCVAGDMPFLSPAAVTLLRDHAPGAVAVAARLGGRPEPLFGRYGRQCAGPIARALAEGRLQAGAFLHMVGALWLDEGALRKVDPALATFENVNSPDDLERAETWVASGRNETL